MRTENTAILFTRPGLGSHTPNAERGCTFKKAGDVKTVLAGKTATPPSPKKPGKVKK